MEPLQWARHPWRPARDAPPSSSAINNLKGVEWGLDDRYRRLAQNFKEAHKRNTVSVRSFHHRGHVCISWSCHSQAFISSSTTSLRQGRPLRLCQLPALWKFWPPSPPISTIPCQQGAQSSSDFRNASWESLKGSWKLSCPRPLDRTFDSTCNPSPSHSNPAYASYRTLNSQPHFLHPSNGSNTWCILIVWLIKGLPSNLKQNT